jgi:hypothetical protein
LKLKKQVATEFAGPAYFSGIARFAAEVASVISSDSIARIIEFITCLALQFKKGG